jgi:hypothetical protein
MRQYNVPELSPLFNRLIVELEKEFEVEIRNLKLTETCSACGQNKPSGRFEELIAVEGPDDNVYKLWNKVMDHPALRHLI